ncbi:putative TIM-barrel fold metal-dependent hydrolase [Desulfosporosinus acidiphilus SJ4]|uniref:Putative TIM-barrel fold metal-dependent hydrolase n=1 Tax=Desulfosporosinus acidiphilus (strain DSM 22704 / JCM 16185 / SJ4) TaxID=646529 RepID=I4D6S6_DESAJ|nr:amidohydrolase family protein [Desulfosporosinus acidiphilus]AFM41500.1 putative TIM-barrel fold metal-dependent hydrolase [Desulfosporosinus acidiphilus SJ4]
MSFIDVHHHLIGKQHLAGMPDWSLELDKESMDRMGLTNALLSLPVAGAPEQTRGINDMIAGLAAKDPKRYGMLACLPSAYVDAALREIEYACDTLKADGFCMPSNASGIYIGDDRMDEILAELNRRSATVLLHPTKAGGEIPSLLVTDLSTYEYPFETSRAMIDLIYRGKIQKYPNIKWIVSHAGGVLPYIAYRVSTVAQENKAMPLTSDEVMSSLKTLYYDVALSTAPYVFATLKELFGTSHIVFGTDAPLRYEGPVTESIQQLKSYRGFDEGEKSKIMSENAKELFPRLR